MFFEHTLKHKKILQLFLPANLFCSIFQKVYMHVKYSSDFFRSLEKPDKTSPNLISNVERSLKKRSSHSQKQPLQTHYSCGFSQSHNYCRNDFFSPSEQGRFGIFRLPMIEPTKKMFQKRKNFFFLPQTRGHQRWCLIRVGLSCGFH